MGPACGGDASERAGIRVEEDGRLFSGRGKCFRSCRCVAGAFDLRFLGFLAGIMFVFAACAWALAFAGCCETCARR